MQHELWFTALLNHAFARPVNAVMQSLPPAFHPANPAVPFTDPVAIQIFVVAVLILLFLLVRSRLDVDKPGPVQHIAEMLHQPDRRDYWSA
jgi:F-type H+-transporting ATPase subunit a